MSTKKSSTTSSSKRGRKAHRKLSDREKVQRQLGHTETQLRQARESRDAARNDQERKNWEGLVTIYSSELENLRGQLERLEEAAGESRNSKARIAAWRNAGRAMPSKTLEADEETMNQFRDAVEAAASQLGKEYAQAFLAGWGTGLRDLSKPTRKKTKTTSTEGSGSDDEPRRSSRLAEGSRDESDAEGEESAGSEGMDTSN